MTGHFRPRIVIMPRPAPPPLAPFTCVICEAEVERDPYQPDWQRPPICVHCTWRASNRLQSRQLPYEYWAVFRRAYALFAAIDQEIARARCAH